MRDRLFPPRNASQHLDLVNPDLSPRITRWGDTACALRPSSLALRAVRAALPERSVGSTASGAQLPNSQFLTLADQVGWCIGGRCAGIVVVWPNPAK